MLMLAYESAVEGARVMGSGDTGVGRVVLCCILFVWLVHVYGLCATAPWTALQCTRGGDWTLRPVFARLGAAGDSAAAAREAERRESKNIHALYSTGPHEATWRVGWRTFLHGPVLITHRDRQ